MNAQVTRLGSFSPRSLAFRSTAGLAGLTAFFLLSTGFTSCGASVGPGGIGVGGVTTLPTYSSGGVVASGHVSAGPAPIYAPAPAAPVGGFYSGNIALTVYTSDYETMTFDVTLREGGSAGPVVLAGQGYRIDSGVTTLDLVDLPYAYYDLELVGVDAWGNAVSYAATGLTLDEPAAVVTLTLANTAIASPVAPAPVAPAPVASYAADLYVTMLLPDGGYYAPAYDFDYTLYQVDAAGQYITVESRQYVPFDASGLLYLPALDLGTYYLMIDAYDAAGARAYTFEGFIDHVSVPTDVAVTLSYAN